ncbi:MAG: hypothetical protein PHP50_05090 [Lachnospiraceae bacterium]|nr:hypothetical protein [Lachnospiraceae bacterium]
MNNQGNSKRRDYLTMGLIGIIGFTILLMVTTFSYMDTKTLTAWSVNFWDLLFEGRLGEYYSYAGINARGAAEWDGMGNFLMLLPWSIWNLPVWVTHYFGGNMDITGFFSICWSKLFLVAMSGLCAYFSYKIVLHRTENRERGLLAALLIMAAPELLLSIGYTGQDEIVYITFFIIALYQYMKGSKWYLFWCVYAVTCCPIMLLPVLILFIMDNKNILAVLGKSVCTILPTVAINLLYLHDEGKAQASRDIWVMLQEMFGFVSFQTTTGIASVAAVLITLLLLAVYFAEHKSEADTETDKNSYLLYYIAVSMVIVCFFTENFFYRTFLYVPFIVLVVLCHNGEQDAKKRSGSLLMLAILSWCRMLTGGFDNPQNMNTFYTNRNAVIAWISGLTGSEKYLNYDGLSEKMVEKLPILTNIMPVLNAAALGLILYLLYVNYPGNQKECKTEISEKMSLAVYCLCMPGLLFIFYVLLFM